MANSKCPKCESTSFEVVINSPKGSAYKMAFVQCSSCGCVVGIMDYYNIGTKVSDLEKKIDNLSFGDSSISSDLNVINQNIDKLFKLVKSLQK
jgi:transcription initiation factor TFIIIB Brf1 subunit/transcription initiation factor TFIIB